jgi:predicted ATP-dependent serine protease
MLGFDYHIFPVSKTQILAHSLPASDIRRSQLRESTARCLRAAKALHLPIILVGHVTKAGEIAGPRVIEHMVDCVLYLEVRNREFCVCGRFDDLPKQ